MSVCTLLWTSSTTKHCVVCHILTEIYKFSLFISSFYFSHFMASWRKKKARDEIEFTQKHPSTHKLVQPHFFSQSISKTSFLEVYHFFSSFSYNIRIYIFYRMHAFLSEGIIYTLLYFYVDLLYSHFVFLCI